MSSKPGTTAEAAQLREIAAAFRRFLDTVRSNRRARAWGNVSQRMVAEQNERALDLAASALDLAARHLGLLSRCRGSYGGSSETDELLNKVGEWAALDTTSRNQQKDAFATDFEAIIEATSGGLLGERDPWIHELGRWASRLEHEKPTGSPVTASASRWQSIQQIEEDIERFAPTKCSILLIGETGVGKEFYARKVHEGSNRSENPFVPVNCANLSKERMQADLFGHTKGAFTGATANRPGHVKKAEGGTLFLDEISELQNLAGLLRFLDSNEVQVLGKDEPQRVNVRVLAATNNPDKIRPDVWQRFDEHARIPPLRDRRDSIPDLVRVLLKSANEEVKEGNRKSDFRIKEDEKRKLAEDPYGWPGNVRQMKGAIETAVRNRRRGRYITADQVLEAARAREQLRPEQA